MPATARFARAGAFWLIVAFVVWNGFFDLLISRGEKQYFLAQARYELGLGERVTIHAVMSRTIRDAVRVASIWAVLVLAAGLGGTAAFSRVRGGESST